MSVEERRRRIIHAVVAERFEKGFAGTAMHSNSARANVFGPRGSELLRERALLSGGPDFTRNRQEFQDKRMPTGKARRPQAGARRSFAVGCGVSTREQFPTL